MKAWSSSGKPSEDGSGFLIPQYLFFEDGLTCFTNTNNKSYRLRFEEGCGSSWVVLGGGLGFSSSRLVGIVVFSWTRFLTVFSPGSWEESCYIQACETVKRRSCKRTSRVVLSKFWGSVQLVAQWQIMYHTPTIPESSLSASYSTMSFNL